MYGSRTRIHLMTIKVFTAPRRTPHFEIWHLGSFSAYPRQSPSSPPSFVFDASLSSPDTFIFAYLGPSKAHSNAFQTRSPRSIPRLGSPSYYLQPRSTRSISGNIPRKQNERRERRNDYVSNWWEPSCEPSQLVPGS